MVTKHLISKDVSTATDATEPAEYRPGLPAVNLLPADLRNAQLGRRAKVRFMLGIVAVAAVTAAGVGLQEARSWSADNALSEQHDRAAQLSSELAELADVDRYSRGVDANKSAIEQTMAKDVDQAGVLRALQSTTNGSVSLTTVTFTTDTTAVQTLEPGAQPGDVPVNPDGSPVAVSAASTSAVSACQGVDLFGGDGAPVGCASLTVSAKSRDALAEWLEDVEADDRFAAPFVSQTASGERGRVSVTAVVALTDAIYSHTYKGFAKGDAR